MLDGGGDTFSRHMQCSPVCLQVVSHSPSVRNRFSSEGSIGGLIEPGFGRASYGVDKSCQLPVSRH